LSKSDAARPLCDATPLPALKLAWQQLGQGPLIEEPTSADEFLAQALELWDSARIPRETSAAPAK
jgi:glutamyl-Q tRNA(Asp) synthetase